MNIHGSTRPAVKPWSRKAKDWLACQGMAARAKQINAGASHLSSCHNGNRLTSEEMVEKVQRVAKVEGCNLIPADLGRPDLNRLAKEKKA